jgi:tetratricopeptide (TPR) repeat protein
MSEDLTRLGPDAFEQLVLALAVHVLGPGITAFGDGPDGGREATFSGRQEYPNTADPWEGYGVLQAKYKDRLFGSGPDATWFLGQVKDELDDWADPGKRRVSEGRRPEYLIFATNVPLSAVPRRGGRDKADELIEKYREALGLKGWDVWDGNQITTYLNAYPDVKRPFTALMTPSDALAEQTVMLGVALETRGAEDATGRLARLRERTVALPAVARPAAELALAENPADTEQILSAVTDPAALPAQTLQAWIDTPPAFLGTPDAPAHASAWALLGEIAAAYGLHRHASTAFERAVSAGSARRPYLLARAAWSALQAGDAARAASIAPPASPASYAEAAYALIAAYTALAAETAPGGGPEPLRDQLRRELAAWNPERPADRDMQARITAEIEMSDPSGSARDRHNAALQTLDGALAGGWLDDTALAAASILRSRAAAGAADRASDLDRAVQLATRVRDAWRGARRDSTLAVRVAVAAASDAGRYRQVIAIGSAAFGQAAAEEARDPEVAKQVILAAAKGVPEVADELAADPGQVPEGFLRAWAQALLALRGTQVSNVSHDELVGLWQQALAEATTIDERLQALQGLATVGADDLPGLDELLASDPATAAELHARAALARDDPDAAINLLHPHRNASASVASILGEAYARLGQIDAAVDTLTAAASRFDYDDLIIQAAIACARAGDPERAERLLTDVLRTAAAGWAGRGRARTRLGEFQADRGAWPEAIASWDSALEEDPYLDSARWQLTYAHASRGDHERAWAVLKGAPGASDETPLPGDPPTPNAAHMALVLLRRNGDFPAAVAYGLRYLSLFGGDERFAGHTLALLTLPTGEQDDSAQATLSAELQGRLEEELTGFFARYPDSQYLRRRGGRDAAELADQINQEARPAPQQATYARELMTAVMRGTHPLGVLAALSSRPYAHCIVTRVAGVLSAEGGDDEHNAGIADARAILGILPAAPAGTASAQAPGQGSQAREPRLRTSAITPTAAVVTDTTALHVRALLPEMADILTRGFREVLLADSAYVDIVAARDELYLPTVGTWVVDQATGRGGLIPVDSDAQSRQRSEIDVVYTLAGECRRTPMPVTDSPGLGDLNGPGFDPWAGALRIAAARGSALWADDIGLRRLARSQGVAAFSTLSLLDAYASIGLVPAGQREEAVRRLIRGYVGDFPPDDNLSRSKIGSGR